MDAVELPLPADVSVSKLLAPDGFGERREADGPDGSIFGSFKGSGCGSYHRDIKCTAKNTEHCSASRYKRNDAELYVHRNLLPGFKTEEGSKRQRLAGLDDPVLSSSKHDCKDFNGKMMKSLSRSSCPKRPRVDQPENSTRADGFDGRDGISRKMRPDITRCTSADKSRIIKQKRCQDGKRSDRKNSRVGGKSKYESFASKSVLISSDPTSGGSNVLGIYGLKSDLHDVTQIVDEPSLSELLDGSYRYHKKCPEKGKKPTSTNESILLSVGKACAILATSGADKKDCTTYLNPDNCVNRILDCSDMHDESGLSSKVQDPCQGSIKDSKMYHPKEILDLLALPPAQDLDAFLLDSKVPSFPLNSSITNMTRLQSASLPSFPWSFSSNGSCKSSADTGKVASTRTTCQSRWIRVCSSSTLSEDNRSGELDSRTLYQREDTLDQRKMLDLLEEIKKISVSAKPSSTVPFSMSQTMPAHVEAHNMDKDSSPQELANLGPCNPLKVKHSGTVDNHFSCDYKVHPLIESFEDKGGLEYGGQGRKLADPPKRNVLHRGNEFNGKDGFTTGMHDCSGTAHCYPCESTAIGRSQSIWWSTSSEISKPGQSPRAVAAAEILQEMASHSDASMAHDRSRGKIKWPKAPSQKTMKARKSTASIDKIDGSFLASKHHDLVKEAGITSTKYKFTASERNSPNISNGGRGHARWPSLAEGTSPVKSARDLALSPKLWHGHVSRPMNSMVSPARVEKGCDSVQRSRSFAGAHINDWSRGRSRRL